MKLRWVKYADGSIELEAWNEREQRWDTVDTVAWGSPEWKAPPT